MNEAISQIPGGAATQVAQQSGNPRAVGLSPEQAQMARDMVTPKEPIPLYHPGEEPSQPPQRPSEGGYLPPELEEQIRGLKHYKEEMVPPPKSYLDQIRDDLKEYDDLTDQELLDAMYNKGQAEGFVPKEVSRDQYYKDMGWMPLTVRDVSRFLGQGASLGHSDELTSLGVAFAAKVMGDKTPFLEIYDEVWAKENEAMSELRSYRPGATLGLELGGGLMTGKVGVKQLQMGAKTPLGKTAAIGTSAGGIYGLGASEEQGLARLGSAGEGAIAGLVLSPVIHGATRIPSKIHDVRIERALKSPDKAAKLGKEYYGAYYRAMLQNDKFGRPTTSAEAHRIAREQIGINTEQLYRISQWVDDGIYHGVTDSKQALNKLVELELVEHLPREAAGDIVAGIDYIHRKIDSEILDIHPMVYRVIQHMENMVYKEKIHKWHSEITPFKRLYRNMKWTGHQKDAIKMGLALFNKDFALAKRYAMANSGQRGVQVIERLERTLNTIRDEAKAAGIEFDLIDDYFPRLVKDSKGLKQYLNSRGKLVGWNKLVSAETKRLGRKLTPTEESKLLNRYLESGTIFKGQKKSIKSTKKRSVDVITEDMRKFYADPITSLDLHIRDMAAAIERRKVFGKHMDIDPASGLENIDKSVGAYVNALNIKPERIDDLRKLLSARFGPGELSGNKILSGLRQFTGGVTLGNPRSAVKQLGDIFVVAGKHGLVNTIKGIPKAMWETGRGTLGLEKPGELSADAFGWMLDMVQEIDTGPFTSNIIKKSASSLYKLGFRHVDRFGKNVAIQAIKNEANKKLSSSKGTRLFIEEHAGIYDGDEIRQLITDIRNENYASQLVSDFIFNQVTRFQPVTRSQMSRFYSENPNLRGMMQFKTWGFSQIDVLRTDIVRGLHSKNADRRKEAARQLAMLTTYLGIGGGIGVVKLQQYISGQEDSLEGLQEWGEEAMWAVLGNFAIDRFAFQKALDNRGFDGLIDSYVVPPAFTIPGKMISEAIKLATIPDDELTPFENERLEAARDLLETTGIGRWINYRFLGGGEEWTKEQAEKRQKERMNRLMQ